MANCQNCSKETDNPKFCSRSCATVYSNKTSPKRKLTRICSECNEIVKSYRHTKCEKHWAEYKEGKYINRTIGEYRALRGGKMEHPSWMHAAIRGFARGWLKHLTKLPCAKCGYDKHVELAHIHPLSDFSDNTLLKDINSEKNVIQLCPNCHWEFDYLSKDSFKELLEAKNKT